MFDVRGSSLVDGWRGSRGSNPNPLGVPGDDRAGKEFVLIAGNDVVDGDGHLCGPETGKSDDSRVRQALHNGEFPKILVQGDKNPPFGVSGGENGGITGILRPFSRPDDVVTEIAEDRQSPSPDAGIEKDGRHQEANAVGKSSIRSWRARREA